MIWGGHFEFGSHLGFRDEINLAPYLDTFSISRATLVPIFMLFTKIEQFFCMDHHYAALLFKPRVKTLLKPSVL